MKLQFVLICLMFIAVFSPIAYATGDQNLLADITCFNSTTRVVGGIDQGYYQDCAWGCKGGECLSGTDLAFNGFLILAVTWGIAFVLIWISNQMSKEEDMAKTITKLLGILMMIIGIIATLGLYETIPHLGVVVKNLLSGIALSFPEAFVLLALFVVIVKIMESMWKGWVRR